MICRSIRVVSPQGAVQLIEGNDLQIWRANEAARFVDIHDLALPLQRDGHNRVIAQVPTSWLLIPHWVADDESR